jgi:hypothetical protein
MSSYQDQRDFGGWLEGGGELPVAGVERTRLSVHRNTFVGTLVEALAESFPVTRALAGHDFFDAMARACVLDAPPRSPVLTDYALAFPAWIFAFAPAAGTPVLVEMAQLEALRLHAFHAEDADPLGLESFHRLACDAALLESTGVRLHPAARWLPSRHALLSLWRAHDEAEHPDRVDLSAIDAGCVEHVLVHRPGFAVQMSLLPPGGVAFLDALAAGASIAQAFGLAAAADARTQAAALFSLLLQQGLAVELFDLSRSPA